MTRSGPADASSHPDGDQPLSAFRKIVLACNDCGHVTALDEEALSLLSAVPTVGLLWAHAFCPACRETGLTGKANLTLSATPMTEPHPTRADAGLTKSTLPPRSLFDRRS